MLSWFASKTPVPPTPLFHEDQVNYKGLENQNAAKKLSQLLSSLDPALIEAFITTLNGAITQDKARIIAAVNSPYQELIIELGNGLGEKLTSNLLNKIWSCALGWSRLISEEDAKAVLIFLGKDFIPIDGISRASVIVASPIAVQRNFLELDEESVLNFLKLPVLLNIILPLFGRVKNEKSRELSEVPITNEELKVIVSELADMPDLKTAAHLQMRLPQFDGNATHETIMAAREQITRNISSVPNISFMLQKLILNGMKVQAIALMRNLNDPAIAARAENFGQIWRQNNENMSFFIKAKSGEIQAIYLSRAKTICVQLAFEGKKINLGNERELISMFYDTMLLTPESGLQELRINKIFDNMGKDDFLRKAMAFKAALLQGDRSAALKIVDDLSLAVSEAPRLGETKNFASTPT